MNLKLKKFFPKNAKILIFFKKFFPKKRQNFNIFYLKLKKKAHFNIFIKFLNYNYFL